MVNERSIVWTREVSSDVVSVVSEKSVVWSVRGQ